MLRSSFFIFLLLSAPVLSVEAQSFRAGAAVRNITPDPLLAVSGGVGTPEPANRKAGDLFARAVVFASGDQKIAIVGIDNLGWPAALADRSRALIESIPAGQILIGATHTHSAPDAYGFPDQNGNVLADLDYLDWCVRQIAEAIKEAEKNLQPAGLKIAVGEAKGKIAYNYYAPQLYDPRCGVIQAIDQSDKVIATLVNYAIHPEVIGNSRGILSPDLCGPLYDRIESEVGGVAIFMNGAQGGMVTADNRLPHGSEANDWQECVRIGELLADQALDIIGKAPRQENPVLQCIAKDVAFPVDSEMMRTIIKHSPHGFALSTDHKISTRLNLVNLGSAQIITIPGEALPNIGYYLKRKMKAPHQFLFGLTNDAFGYILTKEDFNSFRRYDYISRTSLGEMTGEIFIEEALEMIESNPLAIK